MLNSSEKKRLSEIAEVLNPLSARKDQGLNRSENRTYYEMHRKTVHLYDDFLYRCREERLHPRGEDLKYLSSLAAAALDELGGQGEPCPVSLKDYDHLHYGPFLGVSDEGSAAGPIRDAALDSPKARVLKTPDPLQVGASLDAERLAAVGEVAVGPGEYREIRVECMGRILNTTNVGTRLNLRYFKKRPVIRIPGGSTREAIKKAAQEAKAAVRPFLETPDLVPRPIMIFARFDKPRTMSNRLEILTALNTIFQGGEFCAPECHKLGLLTIVPRGLVGVVRVKDAIDIAAEAKLAEVAVKSIIRWEAEDKISMPGILNYFNPHNAREILKYAEKKKVTVSPRNLVDTGTVARSVWSGLSTARRMGFECGKYGLFPLTLEEYDKVAGTVQSWFPDWTAAPAFYIDFPTIDKVDVYEEKDAPKALKRFLHIASGHHIPVVLIDTADKDKGRRILKSRKDDVKGILDWEQIAKIDHYAQNLGIKALWAGGITIDQAYEFGKLGVFGIYVTSAASVSRPVSSAYAVDPMLASEKEPTYQGVSRTKLLLEAGFLVRSLDGQGAKKIAIEIEKQSENLIRSLRKAPTVAFPKTEEKGLQSLLEHAWKKHFEKFS